MDQISVLLKNPPWDIALALTLVAAGFFWGATYGKKSLGFIIINLYVLFGIWPFISVNSLTRGRNPIEIWAISTAIFLILFILLL